MKKWALRIGTFLLSLFLGSGASAVWNSHRLLSLCDIDANPERYTGKNIRLRVFVFNEVVTGGPVPHGPWIVACSVCDRTDRRWPDASVDLDPQQISLLPEHNQVWIRDHVWQEGKSYVTEAILAGRLEPPDDITHCFSPEYHLSQARIERVLANHEFEDSAHGAEWLKSNPR